MSDYVVRLEKYTRFDPEIKILQCIHQRIMDNLVAISWSILISDYQTYTGNKSVISEYLNIHSTRKWDNRTVYSHTMMKRMLS
jgi:hypothetical protein